MNLYRFLRKKLGVGKLSKITAGIIDNIYLQSTPSYLSTIINFFKLRIIFALLFVPSAVIETISNCMLAMSFFIMKLLVNDPAKKPRYQKLSDKSYQRTIKNSLAVIASPFGFINPKLVSFYFISKRDKHTEVMSGGHLYFANHPMQYPETTEQLQKIITSANKKGKKVTVVGAGRSQGQQFMPIDDKSIIINMKHFNNIDVDPNKKTVTVEAGATWGDIQIEANKHALAVKIMQASNVFSIGGSISTNIHGWNKSGTIANTLRSITVMDANGLIKELSPTDELFQHVVGGFNQFGIILAAEIELIDNEKLLEKSILINPADYLKYFKESVVANENNRMHLYRLSLDPHQLLKEGVAVNYIATKKTKIKSTPDFHLEHTKGTRAERIFINVARSFSWIRKLLWLFQKRDMLKPKKMTTTNQIMQPSINAMFNNSHSESEWLQEFFVPGENLAKVIESLGKILTKNDVTLLNATVRYVKQETISQMGYANEEDRFAIVLCFNQLLNKNEVFKTKKWVREVINLALDNDGSYYLPYQSFASREQFLCAYPNAPAVYEKKRQFDPNEIFSSGFSKKYLVPIAPENNHYKNILAKNKNRVLFGQFLDNILDRVDKDKLYALLDDIFKYCDSNQEIYQELSRRVSEIMPTPVGSALRIYRSLSTIKSDLSTQAMMLMHDSKSTPINGMIEVGFPGRFAGPMRNKLNITGQITVMTDAPALSDIIQSGFPKPYDRHIGLDNYAPLDETKFEDDSVDMITCFIGLHHIPDDRIDGFLKSLRRVLRAGGTFLLVDHDITHPRVYDLACLAHSVYNAVMGVSQDEEMNEIRNFKSLEEWTILLEKYGFDATPSDGKMVRNGDPTQNTMLKFVKAADCRKILEQAANQILEEVLSAKPPVAISLYTHIQGKKQQDTMQSQAIPELSRKVRREY